MRCKACDAIMSDKEACQTQFDGSPEDLCFVCLGFSRDESSEPFDNVNKELSELFNNREEEENE